jgi:hypothetical protein
MRLFVGKQIRPFGLILGATIGLHDILAAAVRPKPRLALWLWGGFLAIFWIGFTYRVFNTPGDQQAAGIASLIFGGILLALYAIGAAIIVTVNAVVDQAVENAKRRLLKQYRQ